MSRKFFRRRKKLIKLRYQLKFAFTTVFLLYVYSLIFSIVIFSTLAVEFSSSDSIEYQASIASVVLLLHEKIWPALFFIVILAFIGAIIFSHRAAGPIYRFEKAIEEFLTGNFKERIRLRKHDDFKEIEININMLAEYLDKSKSQDTSFHADLLKKLSTLSSLLQAGGISENKEPCKIADELIRKLVSQPDAFTIIKKDK